MEACPACLSTDNALFCTRDGYSYSACAQCEWIWLCPKPTPAVLSALYDEAYFQDGQNAGYSDYRAEESLHRRNARKRLQRLQAHLAPPASLLEFGCAYGYVASEAQSRGYQVTGVEISEFAAQVARKRGVRVYPSVEEASACGPFDGALFYQVFEHLPAPAATLQQLHGLLHKDALLHFETWDRASLVAKLFGRHWQQLSPPSVLHVFDAASFSRLLSASGYELLEWKRTSKFVGLGTVLTQLAGKCPTPLASALQRVGRSELLSERAVPYSLGDLITARARRL